MITFLFVAVAVVACGRTSNTDSMQPGTQITVTMKDGSIVTGRFVQAKPDAVVVDPAEGGEWKTLPRDQIVSLTPVAPAQGEAAPPAGSPQQTQQPPPQQQQPATAKHNGTGTRAARPESGGTASRGGTGTAPAPEPTFREVTIPAESLVHARLDTEVASDTSRVEDPVQATVAKPVLVDGFEAVPAGSVLKGVVTTARPAGKVKGRAEIGFRFDTLTSGSEQYRVQTRGVGIEAPATKKNDALKIGIPAAGGAILGGILGGGKGAAIGGAVGGGAGTAVVLTTPGKQVRLPSGTAVTVKLIEPLTVRVPIDR